MISQETIEKILEAGVLAPSGENAQPWLFKIDKNIISLFNNPDSDRSLYNYEQSGSFVSHGAVIENIIVAAQGLGFWADVAYFPDSAEPNFVAKITLQEAPANKHPLEGAITLRSTNRKAYDGAPLSKEEKEAIENVPHLKEFPARLAIVENRETIAALAKAASLNEQMLVENPKVHDFFFSHVRWTEEENQKDPKGFFIDTLELKPPQVKALKLLKSPFIAKIFSMIGISRAIGKDNEKVYSTASAMIGIVAKKKTPFDLVMCGRIMEHVWLTATKLGLSIQPTTGSLFLAEGARAANRDSFSVGQQEALKLAKEEIYGALNVNHEQEFVAVLFRIGHGGTPSARAARFPIEHFII